MKTCPACNEQLNDEVVFCPKCGMNQNGGGVPQYKINPYDHTNEFDAKDISENKVFAMLPYLLGIMGVIVAALVKKDSAYVAFHIKQGLILTVTNVFLIMVGVVLCFTFIVPVVAGVCSAIVFVLQIIAFFQVCGGKAKEPGIVRSLGMFK
jgi:uncharacterized membrane protein